GGFPLDAAEAVAADGETVTAYAVLDVIGRLVDKSLVLLDDDDGRYRLLETIRQFALDRLRDGGELAEVRQRAPRWYADWWGSLGRGEHAFDLGPPHPALPDVFAALDWAYDNAPRATPTASVVGWPPIDHRSVATRSSTANSRGSRRATGRTT